MRHTLLGYDTFVWFVHDPTLHFTFVVNESEGTRFCQALQAIFYLSFESRVKDELADHFLFCRVCAILTSKQIETRTQASTLKGCSPKH